MRLDRNKLEFNSCCKQIIMSEYNKLLQELKLLNAKNGLFLKPDENIDEYIDIDKFYNLLPSFNSNNLLELNNDAQKCRVVNKFVFTEEYPDTVMKDEATVTFGAFKTIMCIIFYQNI